MCKKCICLIRVSTIQQSLDEQREKVVASAIADGYKKSEIAVVEGKESAIKLKEEQRETINEMKQIIADNPSVESVYVFAIDRLARRVSVILSVKEYLDERGINLVFLNPHKMGTMRMDEKTGKMVEDELTKLLLMLLSYGAEMEMKIKQARFAVAREQSIKEGKYTGGRIKIGYKLTSDKHFAEGDDADIVRKVFNMYLEDGGSCTSIYRHLSALGYFAPFHINASGSKQIARLLSDKAYIGEGLYPRLIDDETFNAVQTKLATHSQRHKTKDIYFCRGLLYDTEYGTSLYASRSSIAYKSRKTVRTISLSINAMDWMVWHCAFQLLAVYDDDMNTEKEKEYIVKIDENKTKIANYTNDIDDLNAQIARAIDMNIAQPKYYPTDRMEATINKCENEIAKLEKEIANMKTDNQRMQDFLDGITEHTVMYRMNGDWTDEAKKEVIDKLIERIEVTEIGKMKFNIVVKNKIGYIDNSHWEYATLGSKIQLIWVNGAARIDYSTNIKLQKRFERKRYD